MDSRAAAGKLRAGGTQYPGGFHHQPLFRQSIRTMDVDAMTTLVPVEEPAIAGADVQGAKPFLTAAWRDLLMLNFEIDADVLRPYVPNGVELDDYEGRTLASIVAFVFEAPRLYGIPAPWSAHIPEINLRFYVKRYVDGVWRNGVVFIKEIAPWRAFPIAMIANHWYHEHYQLMNVRHQIHTSGTRRYIHYAWKHSRHWNRIDAIACGEAQRPAPHSEQAYILDHWYAYTQQPDGTCIERQVRHVPWKLHAIEAGSLLLRCEVAKLYGSQFVETLSKPPTTVFFSSGSAVGVFSGTRVDSRDKTEHIPMTGQTTSR